MKTGLILEGGAMRGLFSAGVTDVFMEIGIDFDGLIGRFRLQLQIKTAGKNYTIQYQLQQRSQILQFSIPYKDRRSLRSGFLLQRTP